MNVPSVGGGGFSTSDENGSVVDRTPTPSKAPPSRAQEQAESRFPRLIRRAQGNHGSIEIDRERWDVAITCKQWTVATRPPAVADAGGDAVKDTDVAAYRVVNLDNGHRQYYEVTSGQYGQPIMRPEPERAFDLPKNVEYVHCSSGERLNSNEKISGLILKNVAGATVGRFSLTNATKKGIDLNLSDDGCLKVDGKEYYLRSLLAKDKNRIVNYDGFFSEVKPEYGKVKVWEMEDLPL